MQGKTFRIMVEQKEVMELPEPVGDLAEARRVVRVAASSITQAFRAELLVEGDAYMVVRDGVVLFEYTIIVA